MERFRTMSRNYYHSSSVLVFVFSTHNKTSLDSLFSHIQEAKAEVPEALSILVGNVHDSQEVIIKSEDIDHVGEQNDICRTLRFQLSVMSEDEVQQMLQRIAEHLTSDQGLTNENGINLSQGDSFSPTYCYCC